jgi:hypothetical protein
MLDESGQREKENTAGGARSLGTPRPSAISSKTGSHGVINRTHKGKALPLRQLSDGS